MFIITNINVANHLDVQD